MRFLLRYLFSLMGLFFITTSAAAQVAVIEEIRFVGNKTTRDAIMLQEMRVKVGEVVDLLRIEEDRQAVMDLGLFKLVYADVVEVDGRQVLEITVSEKFYIFPLPKIDRSADGDISYGVRLKIDNLSGLNQRLRLTYKRKEGCCNSEGHSNEVNLSFNYPRIAGSPYGLSVGMLYFDTPVVDKLHGGTTSVYGRDYRAFSFGITRWLREDEPSIGWSAHAGPFWRTASYHYQRGVPGIYRYGVAMGLNLGVAYRRVHDYLFSREGTEYGYSIQLGSRAVGSDNTFTQSRFYYRRYYYLNGERHHNLNAQFLMGFSGGQLPLGGAFFAVGGSNSVRGYEKGSLQGDSFFSLNLEYLSPIRGNNEMRGVLFTDLGNAYPDTRSIDLTDFEASSGFGLRYKIKSFVKVDLRFDAAYAYGLEDTVVYFSTRGTF